MDTPISTTRHIQRHCQQRVLPLQLTDHFVIVHLDELDNRYAVRITSHQRLFAQCQGVTVNIVQDITAGINGTDNK